jgi:hypothetical protein
MVNGIQTKNMQPFTQRNIFICTNERVTVSNNFRVFQRPIRPQKLQMWSHSTATYASVADNTKKDLLIVPDVRQQKSGFRLSMLVTIIDTYARRQYITNISTNY